MNVWHCSLREYLDDDNGVFTGLKTFPAYSYAFKFVVEWIPAVRNNAKILLSPNLTNIIAVADE